MILQSYDNPSSSPNSPVLSLLSSSWAGAQHFGHQLWAAGSAISQQPFSPVNPNSLNRDTTLASNGRPTQPLSQVMGARDDRCYPGESIININFCSRSFEILTSGRTSFAKMDGIGHP